MSLEKIIVFGLLIVVVVVLVYLNRAGKAKKNS